MGPKFSNTQVQLQTHSVATIGLMSIITTRVNLTRRGVNCPCSGACPDVGATMLTRRVKLGSQGAPITK
ncbi:hypothetical protein OUZ56_021827 [Daphnia magna]|uniref:Uncharacterized protein n=1 Tax=Daphnia magna TaxID=35525 RepID=A0ABR0AUJ7_9CRUS|nr:hypothetical protein OUZ56_021827 [Daphnia magna]